jgi:glycerol uptake facilitator-like aquaporin
VLRGVTDATTRDPAAPSSARSGAAAASALPARALVAEVLGTAGLLVAVVGSGVATSTGSASQLVEHAVVVGVALAALIVVLLPISGAHFNPVVSLWAWWDGHVPAREAAARGIVQVAGACAGTIAANLMFGEPVVAAGTTARTGVGLWLGEVVATAGLVLVIAVLVRTDRVRHVPAAVGAWVAGAIVFTSSACFANPAVTVARTLTDTWTGMLPADAPAYVLAQLLGLVLAVPLARWLVPDPTPTANRATDPDPPMRPTEHP